MRYYNRTNTCDECGDKLITGKACREHNKEGNWTGRWLCNKCYLKDYFKIGNRDIIYYNRTNTCDECGDKLIPGKACREYNKEGNWTGRWLCKICYYNIDYKDRYDSQNNVIKRIRDFRIGNLDPNSETGKGYIFQQITCKARKIEDLNIKDDNFHSPIDHSRDSELGIIQTKGAVYNPISKIWSLSFQTEQGKEFDYLIVYCMSRDMKNVERVYIIPIEEIDKRIGLTIYKNSITGWYNKYRVDEKLYNDAYHSLDKDDLPALR